jgi:uncharacterized protein (TIGR02217 family)
METFPLVPDWINNTGLKFKTTVVDFESGYEQRTADWHKGKHSFALGWKIMNQTEMDTLINFYNSRKGQFEAFLFNNHRDLIQYVVRFNTDAITFNHVNAYFSDVEVEVIEIA